MVSYLYVLVCANINVSNHLCHINTCVISFAVVSALHTIPSRYCRK